MFLAVCIIGLLGGAQARAGGTGLVAAYSFDEGTGNVLYDSSGLNNHGTISGAIWAAGKYGSSLSFDGTNNMVTVRDADSLRLDTAMTIEAWVQSSKTDDWTSVVLKEAPSGLAYSLYGSTPDGGGGSWIRPTYPSSDVAAQTGARIAMGTWVHLSATWDGKVIRYYEDGVEKATKRVSKRRARSIVDANGALRIGGNNVWGEWFTGKIDEVRIYNRALAPSEIATDQNTPVAVASEGNRSPDTTASTAPPATPAPTTLAPTTTTPTTTTPTTTTTLPSSSSTSLSLPRVAWEGGSAYWAKFPMAAAAGWTSPSFFPFTVHLSKPTQASQLASLGVNVIQGVETNNGSLNLLKSAGIFGILQGDEWNYADAGTNSAIVGWSASDECEMGYSCGGDATNETQRLARQADKVTRLRGFNDGRFVGANFGNGVLHTYWAPNTMDDHMALMDFSSVDKYAYTSPGVRNEYGRAPDWTAVGGTAANAKSSAAYGWQADQLMKWQDPNRRQPIWVFVETAKPLLNESGSGVITPDQLEGAIWSAIANEARGISLFQHNNSASTGCGFYSLVDSGCDATKARLKKVTGDVRSLAPVINSQSYSWTFNTTTDTMLKAYNGAAYVFASIGVADTVGSKTFTLPPGISGTTVEVVGEGRSIPVTNGQFTDSFAAEYSHHTYRLTI